MLLFSLALAALARSASAELAWQAPAQCPRGAEVSKEIDRLLAGSEYPQGALNEFALTVTHDARTGVFVVHITRSHGGGARQERVVEATDCGELVQAAALAVALAVNPELDPTPPPAPSPSSPITTQPGTAVEPTSTAAATTAPSPPQQSPPPATEAIPGGQPPAGPAAAPAAPAVIASAPVTPPTADQRPASGPLSSPSLTYPRISAFAFLAGDSGSMPEAALGFGAGAAALLGAATRVQLALEFFSPTETEPDPSGAYARFGLYRAHLSGCFSPVADRILLFGCAVLQTGVLRAQGRGVADVHETSRAWLAAGGDLLVLGALADRASLQLRAGVVRPLIERDYVMNGTSVHQVSSWVFDAALGVEFRFN